jgi:predicted double-glycine peptidase
LGHEAVLVEQGDSGLLWRCLADEQPLIVFLDGAELSDETGRPHAVVVMGYENGEVLYMDPSVGEERQISAEIFWRAWHSLGGDGLLVWVND